MKSKMLATITLAIATCTLSLVPIQRAEAVTIFLVCGTVALSVTGGPPTSAGCKVTYFAGGSGRHLTLAVDYSSCTPNCVIVPQTYYTERSVGLFSSGEFGHYVGRNCVVQAAALAQGLAFNLSTSRTNPIVQQKQDIGFGTIPFWCAGSFPFAVTPD